MTQEKALTLEELEERRVIKLMCEKDHLFFTRYFFKKRTGVNFIVNWHHRLIADHLLEVEKGNIQNLIINVPPGSSKTEMVVINWIARCLAINARARFLHVSCSQTLVEINSATTKEIVLSQAYQDLWPRTIRTDAKGKKRWATTYVDHRGNTLDGGGMYASAIAGQIIGFRAGHMEEGFQGAIIIDDPIKVREAERISGRREVNGLIKSTLKSRRALSTTPIVMIMQRLHQEDPTGFLLDEGGMALKWTHLKIPAIQINAKGEEESYWEHKEPIEELIKARIDDKYTFYGQYMQEPAPVGNGEFSKDYIQYYDPDCDTFSCKNMNVWILYDPANSKKANADWTAMVVLGLAPDNNYYILDLIRDKLNPTERVNALIKLHRKWNSRCGKPPRVAIEQYGMMSDEFYIKKAMADENYRFGTVTVAGKLQKEERIRRLIPIWETLRVYLPDKIMYRDYKDEVRELVEELIEDELMMFPVGKNDDMIDAWTRIFDVPAPFPKEQKQFIAGGELKPKFAGEFKNEDIMSW